MAEIKTDPAVLRAMREAAGRPATQAEIQEQTVSFVMSSFRKTSEVTRVRVEEVLAEQSGRD